MTIDWQAVVTQFDPLPELDAAGTAILQRLLVAGRSYAAAGNPDVHHESAEHREWRGLPASQRVNRTEPPYFVVEYYRRLVAPIGLWSVPFELPPDAREAVAFWGPRDPAVARRITSYFRGAAVGAARAAAFARTPWLGRIEAELVSAVTAAQDYLEAN